jgi:adenine-specific DNA-methyltransferase
MARSPRRNGIKRSVSDEATPVVQDYRHKHEAVARPEAGAAPRFRAKKESVTYRYDSSLSPALDWDMSPARDIASWLLAAIEDAAALPSQTFPAPRELRGADGGVVLRVSGLQDALAALKRMQAPFLNWAGKAERLSFDVPTLPLFVHERLSTEAIVQTLEGHRKRADQSNMFGLFADPQLPMSAQVNAYAHRSGWVNRMILGDSLSVMNSLAQFEGLTRQVQCIYMDPPYGVKFGSNFQPFVRKRDVRNNDDVDMTREPEMVQAYRDTWSLGLHSYLTYLRDRLTVARDLLTISGSVFVQISDDNLHHVRELMDEVFGAENFCSIIAFSKTSGASSTLLPTVTDYLIWFARDVTKVRYRQIYRNKIAGDEGGSQYTWAEHPNGERCNYGTADRLTNAPEGSRIFAHGDMASPGLGQSFEIEIDGKRLLPSKSNHWKTGPEGIERLRQARRFMLLGNSLRYIRYLSDFPVFPITNSWSDTGTSGFASEKLYVVQTLPQVVQRCILMTTNPGDLVVDPTCGSGTTAYVAEQWGRRWITIDTSRVPLALARQRLLTATFPWYQLKDEQSGPAGGFVYARRKNRKGDEIGGIVPHVTLKSIANNEPPAEEVLVDRPEPIDNVTRVSGPFVVEAVLPAPQPLEVTDEPATADAPANHVVRMIEILRRSPALALPGGGKVTLKSIRRPGRTLNLSAEALVEHDTAGGTVTLGAAVEAAHETNTNALPFSSRPVAILFGPANGSVTARAVLDAAKEANAKNYTHLYVIGFGFTAEAQAEIDAGEDVLGLPASRVTMTIDVLMGDLLKTQRSSQIFAITGSPEIAVTRLDEAAEDGTPRWQVRLLGLDTFDPATMQADHMNGSNVPMWMLDTAWNGMAFKADQVFFPRTSAWDNLRKALKATHEDSVWEHLRGDTSAPFAADAGTDIAVKVLDDRGNELLKVAHLETAGRA